MRSLEMTAITVYILTFNCGRTLIDIDLFSNYLFSGLSSSNLPDLLVLNLQEIAPIPHSLIGGSFLVPYFTNFYHAVQKSARKLSGQERPVYTPISARNLGMTGIMIFAKDKAAIQDIEIGGVGVGFLEMGNKGAVGMRFKYHGTELTFVSAHLAAMEDQLKRRNEDFKNIVRGLVFSSTTADGNNNSLSSEEQPLLSISSHDASIYKPTSHLFFSGDLNYRTSLLSPSPNDHINAFPQPHYEPDHENHFSELFKSDQLTQERLAGRTLHGLQEAEITFPPTYKYDPIKQPAFGSDEDVRKWHWARHRWPSWCDRVLYLEIPAWLKRKQPDAKLIIGKYSALPLFPTSDHRPVTLELSIPGGKIPSPDEDEEGNDPRIHPPFEVDIDWKRKRERARTLEVIVGFVMYFTTTLEGGAVFIALILGTLGAFFAIRAQLGMIAS